MHDYRKPLFIPLRTKWFRAFESGEKNKEYRAFGPRWNERTCNPGRKAVLAHGYGWPRLNRRVVAFEIMPRALAPEEAREIFPDAAMIIAIELR